MLVTASVAFSYVSRNVMQDSDSNLQQTEKKESTSKSSKESFGHTASGSFGDAISQGDINKLKITDITFVNTEDQRKIISGPGNTFKDEDVRYICPKISYTGLDGNAYGELGVKIYSPSDELLAEDPSDEYSYTVPEKFGEGNGNKLLPGWGDSEECIFDPGEWMCEIWLKGRMLASAPFTIESNGNVKIKRVWIDENIIHKGNKGMLIHVDFEAKGLKDHELVVSADFFHGDESVVKDTDGSYANADGQVSVSARAPILYNVSNYSDFKIFIPADQLHDKSSDQLHDQSSDQLHDKSSGLKLRIHVHDTTTGNSFHSDLQPLSPAH